MKSKIREKFLEKRNLLSKEDIIKKSLEIKKKMFSLSEFNNANTILFYVSKDSEVYTYGMIRELLNKKNKKTVVPKVKKENLVLSLLCNFNELEKGAFNVLEPKPECIRIINPTKIEVALIPGIAFDLRGHRVGYGKGYYDRLLKKTKALKIGLAFEEQIIDNLPNEYEDVAMDLIVTDKRIIKCK